jgi:hypothetical protein
LVLVVLDLVAVVVLVVLVMADRSSALRFPTGRNSNNLYRLGSLVIRPLNSRRTTR